MAIDHFDDEAAVSLHHQGREVPAGYQVADERLVQVGADIGEIDFPEAPRPIDQRIGAPDAVDEHIETACFVSNAGGKPRHFLLTRVVDAQSDGATTGLTNQRNCFVEGLRAIHAFGLPRSAPTRAVDNGAGLPERSRNAPPGAPRRSGDQCNLAGKTRFLYSHVGRPPLLSGAYII